MTEITITLTPITALNNWVHLNLGLKEFGIPEIEEMLEYEMTHRKRADYVRRIHQRLNKLKTMQEREELLHENETGIPQATNT